MSIIRHADTLTILDPDTLTIRHSDASIRGRVALSRLRPIEHSTQMSWNKSKWFKIEEAREIPVMNWAARSMNGVFASFMKTNPLAGLPQIALA